MWCYGSVHHVAPRQSTYCPHQSEESWGQKKKENFKFNQIVKDGKQNVFSLEGHVLYWFYKKNKDCKVWFTSQFGRHGKNVWTLKYFKGKQSVLSLLSCQTLEGVRTQAGEWLAST